MQAWVHGWAHLAQKLSITLPTQMLDEVAEDAIGALKPVAAVGRSGQRAHTLLKEWQAQA